MKISLKLQDHQQSQHQSSDLAPSRPSPLPLLLRAKLPVTIFSLPFLSHLSTTTTHPSDLSLSLSTNFSSGPSLKLTYFTAAASSSVATTPPFTLTMKSGTGLFGSPKSSPLVISANFSFNPSNPNYPNPTFSLFFKPQLGSFSLRKSTFSHSEPVVNSESANGSVGFESSSFGFVSLEKPEVVSKDSKLSILRGVELAARTHIPFAKTASLNFRWTTKFVKDQMPFLRINKIGFQKVDAVPPKDNDDENTIEKSSKKIDDGELEVLKCMCSFMKRELDDLKSFNIEMKRELENLNAIDVRKRDEIGKKLEFEVQKSNGNRVLYKGNGNGDNRKEEKRNGNAAIAADLENELQRALKSAGA